MTNQPIHPDAISDDERHRRAIARTIWEHGNHAVPKLHNQREGWEAIEVAARLYILHVVNQAQQGQEAAPETEFKRRLILRDLSALLHEKLGLSENDTRVNLSLFVDRVNAGVVEATGEKPHSVIQAGAMIHKRPVKHVGDGEIHLTSRQRDLLLRILLPQSIVDEYWNDLPNLRDIIGPILDLVEPIKGKLSAVNGESYRTVREAQLAIIRDAYPNEHSDVIPLAQTLYQVLSAAEGVVKALRQEAGQAPRSGCADISQHQLKPAQRELASVLTHISNWDKTRANMAAKEFTEEMSKLLAYEARFPSTEASAAR